jgi:hypothetical protein
VILKPAWAIAFLLIAKVVGYVIKLLKLITPLARLLVTTPAAWAVACIVVLWLISDRRYVIVASTLAVIGVGAVLWIAAGRTAIRNLVSAISAARR